MELFMILQIVFIFVSFLFTLLFVLLPIRLVPLDPTKLTQRRTQRVVDFCNCFAGGVFLGTCFLQLVPHVQRKFEEAFNKAQLPLDYCSALTQFVSMIGFFLVLLMEQVIKVCQHSSSSSSRSGEQDSQEMGQVKSYIVAVSSSESDTDVDSDVELFQQEKRGMLKTQVSTKSSNTGVNAAEIKTTSNKSNGRLKSKSVHISGDKNGRRTGNGSKIVSPRSEQNGANGSCGHRDRVNYSKNESRLTREDSFLRCIVLLLALGIHSLFEGVAIGLQDDLWTLVGLSIGVGLHGVLMAFALGISLARQELSRATLYKLSIAFSIMIPAGIAIGMLVMLFLHVDSSAGGTTSGTNHSTSDGDGTQHVGFVGSLVSAVLQALTAGTFIYVIFFDILQAQINRNLDRILKVLITFVGFFIVGALRFVITVYH